MIFKDTVIDVNCFLVIFNLLIGVTDLGQGANLHDIARGLIFDFFESGRDAINKVFGGGIGDMIEDAYKKILRAFLPDPNGSLKNPLTWVGKAIPAPIRKWANAPSAKEEKRTAIGYSTRIILSRLCQECPAKSHPCHPLRFLRPVYRPALPHALAILGLHLFQEAL